MSLPARRRPMRRRSSKLAAAMREYAPKAAAFLAERPRCEYPLGCDQWATEVHHRRGRTGWRLLAEEWWASSCRKHNELAETDTGLALRVGWLLPADPEVTP